MNYIPNSLKFLFFFISATSYALDSGRIEEQANQQIESLYQRLNEQPQKNMADRIDWVSAQLLNQPYVLGSLGEGPKADYDQFPRYRYDAFDCDTYVNTVLALALSQSLQSFQSCIINLRYQDGKLSYIHRNHFTSLDWNPNNQQQGILRDITQTIKDKQNQPVALMAEALIDKPNWYAVKTISTIRLQEANPKLQETRLQELKEKGSHLPKTIAKIPYVPLTSLFNKDEQANEMIFSQIPHGAVIEIVRPNWDLRKTEGTALNVSHLGFAIRKKDKLYFREASSEYGKVVDVLMEDYLRRALKSPTIKGINVQVVVAEDCLIKRMDTASL